MASGRPNRRLFSPKATNAICRPLFPINCPPPPSPCPPLPPPPPPCPPLPPPPPCPPLLTVSEESTTIRFHHSRSIVPALSVAAASVVSVSAIMILLTLLLIRLRRRSSAAREDPVAAAAPLEDDDGGDGDGDGEEVMHHVWYIRTAGLDESFIESITAWAYKAGDGVLGASATGCSVCLSDFRDGELVRLLPKCDHAFHLGCIDTWLRSHVNCPLCRAPIFAPTSVTAATTPSSSSLPPPESGVVLAGPNTVASADDDQMAGRQIDLSPGTSEEELEGERSELEAENRAVAVPIPSAELQVPTDIGEDEFLPIRRSFSVNSISPELEGSLRNINNKKKQALEENSHARTTTRAKHARHASSFRKEMGRSLASAMYLQIDPFLDKPSPFPQLLSPEDLRARSSKGIASPSQSAMVGFPTFQAPFTYNGSARKPRLSVFCSNKQLYAMLVDDQNKKTLFYGSTLQKSIRGNPPCTSAEAAQKVGEELIEACKNLNISEISSYDRNGCKTGERISAFEIPISLHGFLFS
ncbi:hypothetical protein ZIOFF_060909 [Zingiber officinale]|uniref:RING-type E3 ubiquitin transferase n=1 Tax=Zingiber officinale TaxID=94328 RepID=A0A8J5FHB5_ZINOF|nr:hypothetical protein ZIOFF_060909 [Zingiber officinale]